MGTVHKFRRPPKNQQQFRGYRPRPIKAASEEKRPRFQLRGWQGSVAAWLALILLAVAVWAGGVLIGNA